jgi:hypothetical protein
MHLQVRNSPCIELKFRARGLLSRYACDDLQKLKSSLTLSISGASTVLHNLIHTKTGEEAFSKHHRGRHGNMPMCGASMLET